MNDTVISNEKLQEMKKLARKTRELKLKMKEILWDNFGTNDEYNILKKELRKTRKKLTNLILEI